MCHMCASYFCISLQKINYLHTCKYTYVIPQEINKYFVSSVYLQFYIRQFYESFTRLETVYSMYCGLVITVIHFISTILLLYGALTVITVYVTIRENDFVIKQGISFGRTIVTSWRPG